MLGVRWSEATTTLDVDFAHAGKNISVALPADLRIDVYSVLVSLEMGLLPIAQFNGKAGTQYRNPEDQELRLDFVISATRGWKPVNMPELNFTLKPLKFMWFSLQNTTKGCVISRLGACVVNLPAPERYAVHKLIVYGERPVSERTKSTKDLLQAAALIGYFAHSGQSNVGKMLFRAVKDGAAMLCRVWDALLRLVPEMAAPALWK